MNSIQKWQYEISKIDELIGNKAKYPIATIEYALNEQMHKQKEMISQINQTLENYKEISDINSQLIKNTIEQSTIAVTGTLENGFNLIAKINKNGLNDISRDLNKLNQNNINGFETTVKTLKLINLTINWGFSKIIELNRLQNILSEDIIKLLNIPDNEKERKRYIEEGIKFLKKSINNNEFFEDSKEFFEKAYKLYRQDYFVSYNLGLIHLFSMKHLNIELARKYFNNAAKYAYADIDEQNIGYSKNTSSFENHIDPKTISINSYLYEARCFYLLQNKENALKTINKAYELDNKLTDVIYDKAKYLIINNHINESIQELDLAIKKNRFVTLKVIVDEDFMIHPEIKNYLQKIKEDTINEAKYEINKCRKIIRNDSYNYQILNKAINNIKKDTFLNGKYALDIINNENLYEKIKNENMLKNFITSKLNYINQHIAKDTNFSNHIKKLHYLINLNTPESIKETHKLLTIPIKFTYQYFPYYEGKFLLKEKVINLQLEKHIIFEKELRKIIQKVINIQKKYKELDDLKTKSSENKTKIKKYNITAKGSAGSVFAYIGTVISVYLTIHLFNYWIGRHPRNPESIESFYIVGAALLSLIMTPISGFLVFFSFGLVSDEWEYYKQIFNQLFNLNTITKLKNDFNALINNINNKKEAISLDEEEIMKIINNSKFIRLYDIKV